MILANAIKQRFLAGLSYSDARQLCCWLHILKNNLPSEFGSSSGDKNELSDAFAHLSCIGYLDSEGSSASEVENCQLPSHWLAVIDSAYRGGDDLDSSFPQRFPDIFPPIMPNTILEIQKICDAEIESNPWRFEGDRDEPLTDVRLSDLELSFGLRLPSVYRNHLCRFGAGDFGSGVVWSPDPESTWSLWDEFNRLPDLIQAQALPFSDSNTDCRPDMDYYFFTHQNGVVNDEVAVYDISKPAIIEHCYTKTFQDFLIKECLYPIEGAE